jgi:hypothetical protein
MDSNMQAAYHEFMLGKNNSGLAPSPIEKNSGNNKGSGRKKRFYQPTLRALQGRLEEWKETNQKLEALFRSISNLRDRVHWESEYFTTLPRGPSDEGTMLTQEGKEPSWRDSGYRSAFSQRNSGGALSTEDVHLALDHDLLQHERMLSAIRSLLATLAQTVDEIGRRLDEWMLQNLGDQTYHHTSDDRNFATLVEEQNTLQLVQKVYSTLASDLYLKQKMATRVFDSCHDGLLGGGNEISPNSSSWQSDPRDVIKKISKELSGSEHKKHVSNLVNKLMNIW